MTPTAEQISDVRANIYDLDSNNYKFNDNQISRFIVKANGNINIATAMALRGLVALAAIRASQSIGSYSESRDAKALLDLAKEFEAKAAEEGVAANGKEIAYDAVAQIVYNEFNGEEVIVNMALEE